MAVPEQGSIKQVFLNVLTTTVFVFFVVSAYFVYILNYHIENNI